MLLALIVIGLLLLLFAGMSLVGWLTIRSFINQEWLGAVAGLFCLTLVIWVLISSQVIG